MKKLVPAIVLSVMVVLMTAGSTAAQGKRLDSSPAAFRTFFAKFMGAVKRGDKAAVASMTSFPLEWGFDAGDEGKYSRAQFIRSGFMKIFGPSPKKFLLEKDPEFSKDGRDYIISTIDAAHIVFTKKGQTFLFSSYFVEP